MKEREAPFSRLVIQYSKIVGLDKFYIKRIRFFNYSFVCGCGVLINTFILYLMVPFFPLYLANWIAIACAWMSNYAFSVGPFGHLFGLREKK